MKIKICGMTNKEDALNAISLGVDAVGFIFNAKSPRYITPQEAEEITPFLPPFVTIVGVFIDSTLDEIRETSERCKLDIIQLHGNESPEFCLQVKQRVIKAFRIRDLDDLDVIANYQGMISAMLLDTKVADIEGGTGKTFDWGLAIKAQDDNDIPLILAGGINATNIQKAIQLVNPYAVDLSSGVESEPGRKDYNKMRELVEAAHRL